jgi:hypothetical protein
MVCLNLARQIPIQIPEINVGVFETYLVAGPGNIMKAVIDVVDVLYAHKTVYYFRSHILSSGKLNLAWNKKVTSVT